MTIQGQKTFVTMQQDISQIALKTPYGQVAPSSGSVTNILVKELINDAYMEICSERDWWFMFNYAGFTTVPFQVLPYIFPDNVQEIRYMTIPAYQQKLKYATFEQWIVNYPGRYTNVGPTKPWAYIPGPPAVDNALQYFLFPTADANNGNNYNVEYGFKQRIVPLANDYDFPIIPAEFQQVIINRALEKLFRIMNDPRQETYSDGEGMNTDANRRYNAFWLKNEQFTDYVAKFRNYETENAFVSSTDINRQLFVPF